MRRPGREPLARPAVCLALYALLGVASFLPQSLHPADTVAYVGDSVESVYIVAWNVHRFFSSPARLFDANLLDSIGAVGLARLSVGGFLWYHYKTMPEIVEYLRRELALTGQFHFPRSRELANEKIAFTKAALEQFERELRL